MNPALLVVLQNAVLHNASVYLTITSTAVPATDLGFLLHKHPGRAQVTDLPVGQAHVFYPEATEKRCTAALLLEVDPIALVRGRRTGAGDSLSHYVNDRPYVASSMLAVALARVFRTAMAGRCDQRPELAATPLPLTIRIPVLPRGTGGRSPADADGLVRRLFAPLGWTVDETVLPLDPEVPSWGDSRFAEVRLTGTMPLAAALSHLYVLLPVLDDGKHYWVTDDEVDKLVRAGRSWLPAHPQRDLITRRYLAHQRDLVLTAVGRLAEADQTPAESFDNAIVDNAIADSAIADSAIAEGAARIDVRPGVVSIAVDQSSQPPSLAAQRVAAVLAELRAAGAARIADIGCGEGALLRELVRDPAFTEVLGVDVSARALALAERRLGLDRMPDSQRARLQLIQSSLTYRDQRVAGYDAVVLMEVIEHLDPPRLPSLVSSVFGHARPRTVLVSTPNAEFNGTYPGLAAGAMRHPDHRFEWTRAQFRDWATSTAAAHGYTVRFAGIGPTDAELGTATQLGVFSRTDVAQQESAGSRAAGGVSR